MARERELPELITYDAKAVVQLIRERRRVARSNATDTRWLERHGQKWRITVAVPRDMHKVLGTRLKQNLNTDSLAVANLMKLKVVANLHARIQQTRESRLGKPRAVMQEAVGVAKYIERHSGGIPHAALDLEIRRRAEEILGPDTGVKTVGDEAEMVPIYDPQREALSKDYLAVAYGKAIPMMAHHASYLKKSSVKPRTKADDVRAMQYLVRWCEKEGVPQTLQAIDAKKASLFMDELGELCGGLAARTQNKYLGRLSRYWAFMVKRRTVEFNPWMGMVVEVPATKHDEEERAFYDAEVHTLLAGGAEPKLMDVMLIGALTGARLDAIVDLRVRDTIIGAFTFKPQKKEKKARDVPIHAALTSMVARRTAGRDPEEPFFPDWPAPAKMGSLRERSFKASNRFTAYRRACGVDETVVGKRRALVNFHSFRRWFITKAERAGNPEALIAAIVGHKRTGMTLGRYSEGPEWQAARRCIDSVKLPPTDGSLIKEARSLSPRRRERQEWEAPKHEASLPGPSTLPASPPPHRRSVRTRAPTAREEAKGS